MIYAWHLWNAHLGSRPPCTRKRRCVYARASLRRGTRARRPRFPGSAQEYSSRSLPCLPSPDHRRSRLHSAAARYREARRSLHTPASAQSRRGLDWMNFFIADVQTGFGTFVAFYLAQSGWSQASVGVALAAGGIAGVVSQIPGGALADAVTWKRGLGRARHSHDRARPRCSSRLKPNFVFGVSRANPAGRDGRHHYARRSARISLGLVGRSAMSVRTGRNYRYAAGGHALTAALMGVAGAYLRERRDLHRRGAVVRSRADRAQLHPRRGDRLRQSAQCRARQTRGRRGARRRPLQKSQARPVHRARRCCSSGRCFDAAVDRGKSRRFGSRRRRRSGCRGSSSCRRSSWRCWRRGSAFIPRNADAVRCC